MKGPAGIKPTLGFDIEQAASATGSYALEAEPLGPFFRMRFFNDIESVMLIGNREQTRQIYEEIGRALDLGRDRARKRRDKSVRPRPDQRQPKPR